MQKFVAAHADWLTVVRLPAYAPELNATEGVWSVAREMIHVGGSVLLF